MTRFVYHGVAQTFLNLVTIDNQVVKAVDGATYDLAYDPHDARFTSVAAGSTPAASIPAVSPATADETSPVSSVTAPESPERGLDSPESDANEETP